MKIAERLLKLEFIYHSRAEYNNLASRGQNRYVIKKCQFTDIRVAFVRAVEEPYRTRSFNS